jgi:hypothetical protein
VANHRNPARVYLRKRNGTRCNLRKPRRGTAPGSSVRTRQAPDRIPDLVGSKRQDGRWPMKRRTRGRHARPSRAKQMTKRAATTGIAGAAALALPVVIPGNAHSARGVPATQTITLDFHTNHRPHAHIRPQATDALYIIRPGDTLSAIAKREYHNKSHWPLIWRHNRSRIHNPNSIIAGKAIRIPPDGKVSARLTNMAYEAISPPPPPPPPAPVASAPVYAPAPAGPAPQAPPATTGSYSAASGSFQQCVIQRESGGNPGAVNPSSGAGGLYGFLPSTWQALGHSGLPENASVAEQNQAFQQEYAQGGTSAWSPYDGC